MAWKDLTLSQRAELMNIMRKGGVKTPKEMQKVYDSYESQSPIAEGITPSFGGEIRQGKKWNFLDHYLADNPQVAHGLRKAGVLLGDAARVATGINIRDVEISPRKMTDFGDLSRQLDKTDNPDSAVDRMSRVGTPAAAVSRAAKPIIDVFKEHLPNSQVVQGVSRFANNLRKADRFVNMGQFIDDFATPVNQFKKGGGTREVKKGESWISIANDLGISLTDLLEYNGISPTSKEALPAIHPGQKIYVANPFNLSAAQVSAKAPRDYADYGQRGQQMLDNYAIAVQRGDIQFKDVPEPYKQAVYQRGITLKTDDFARKTFNTGLNTALFLADPVGYTAGFAAQKGLAYANDRASGRNEYTAKDILGYTPVMGREYAEEHPVQAGIADVAAGVVGGGVIRNTGNIISNARQAFQNAAATTGLERQVLSYPTATKGTFGTVYNSATKGVGKTGTMRMGRGASGYSPNVSTKGTFSNASSGAPGQVMWNTPDAVLPVSPLPWSGPGLPPVTVPPSAPPYTPPTKPSQDKHIYEQQTFSRWQLPNPSGEMGEYVPGTGLMYIKGQAPVGVTIPQQALTQETLELDEGYVPRKAIFVKGNIEGDPSNVYSGLGITYDSENPGSLIIGSYKKGGHKIHIKPENKGKFTALKKRTGHSASWFKAHGTPAQKKMAVFALNAKKWKHEHGGIKF